jgi:hypothetical protein
MTSFFIALLRRFFFIAPVLQCLASSHGWQRAVVFSSTAMAAVAQLQREAVASR